MAKTSKATTIEQPAMTLHVLAEDELRRLRTRAEISRWLSLLAAFVGGLIALVAALQGGTQNTSFQVSTKQTEAVQQLQIEVQRIAQDQRRLRKSLEASPSDANTQLLSTRLTEISIRQDRIERSLMTNPQRALELPLLRKDLDDMQKTNEQRLESIKATVDQAYDLNKWLLGTIGISIFGLGLSNLLNRKKADA